MSGGAPDPYEVLGVPAGAGAEELRAAWRRLARQSHPDHGGDAEVFRRARTAFDRLRLQAAPAAGDLGPTLVPRLRPPEVARRWWRRRRDRVRRPRVV